MIIEPWKSSQNCHITHFYSNKSVKNGKFIGGLDEQNGMEVFMCRIRLPDTCENLCVYIMYVKFTRRYLARVAQEIWWTQIPERFCEKGT